MFKRLRKTQSVKSIAASYESYADFARNAPKKDKEAVISDAIRRANEVQKQVASAH